MIYLILVLLAAVGTAGYCYTLLSGANRIVRAVFLGLMWPVLWPAIIITHIQGKNNVLCGWCGKSVAPMISTPANMAKWREHYLHECTGHPLLQSRDEARAVLKRARDVIKFYCKLNPTKVDGMGGRIEGPYDPHILLGEINLILLDPGEEPEGWEKTK